MAARERRKCWAICSPIVYESIIDDEALTCQAKDIVYGRLAYDIGEGAMAIRSEEEWAERAAAYVKPKYGNQK